MGRCQSGLEALRNSPAKLPLHMMHKPVIIVKSSTTRQEAAQNAPLVVYLSDSHAWRRCLPCTLEAAA